MQQDEMTVLMGRTERLVSALTGAILSTTEAAAERIELAAQVARIEQRMLAFSSVLEVVAAQKAAILERQKEAKGPLKALLGRQVEALTAQECGILERAGLPQEAARGAVKAADENPRLYARNGRKFQPVGNGTEG
jgi:hypothetical protein